MANKLKYAELSGRKSYVDEILSEFGTLDDIITDRLATLKVSMDKLKDIPIDELSKEQMEKRIEGMMPNFQQEIVDGSNKDFWFEI